MQQHSDFWIQWFKKFQVVEAVVGESTNMTAAQISAIEEQDGFRLPSDYKDFCTVFGTCAFFNMSCVYCPSKSLSIDMLYSTQEELSRQRESGFRFVSVDSKMIQNIEHLLSGAGFAFAEGREAKIYIFDTESYLKSDKSCDIWSADAAGSMDDFVFLGRSFRDFFLRFCVEISENLPDDNTPAMDLSQQKRQLVKFNSNNFLSLNDILDEASYEDSDSR
jgi:hypothetical protein